MTNSNNYIIANWKMYGSINDLKSIKKVIKISKKPNFRKTKIIYCPPFTLLNSFHKLTNKTPLNIGAQNCHHSEFFGSYTGSISSNMIKSVGAKYVIIGHSENRKEGESNLIINQKIYSALNQKLKVIFCIGETLNEKKKKKTNIVLKKQINEGLKKQYTEGDRYVPVSWLRKFEGGRVFYTNLGHNESTFWNSSVMKHCLDGLQYALGDLAADATPSSKIKRSAALAPSKP